MVNRDTILYRYSLDNARHCGEVPQWRESHAANIECRKAIEEAIANGYKDNKLKSGCAKAIIDQYGFDRTNFILRCTLKLSRNDGRYSDENRAWSVNMRMSDSNIKGDYKLNSHPSLVEGFINQARAEWDKLGLYSYDHCVKSDEPLDFEKKVLIIRPDVLKDAYKTPEDQLFLVTSGFGCSPNKIGRGVYGVFLKDGEFTSYDRSSFIGVMDEKFIPEWAAEAVEKTLNPPQPESEQSM